MPRSTTGNPGLELGLALGAGWEEGRDKIVFGNPGGFGLWLEQLIAESTGKEGKGLVPAAGESADGARPAAASRSTSPIRTTSAPSSSASSWRRR